MGQPWLKAESRDDAADLALIKVDNEIVRPVARALLVARGSAGHLVMIVVMIHEVAGVRFVRFQSRIACKLERAGHLDQHVLKTSSKADCAVSFALSGDNRLRAVEGAGRGRGAGAATQ